MAGCQRIGRRQAVAYPTTGGEGEPMRKLVLYTLAGAVAAFYAGVAGAAALPYVGAVTSFVHNAAAAVARPATTPAVTVRGQGTAGRAHTNTRHVHGVSAREKATGGRATAARRT